MSVATAHMVYFKCSCHVLKPQKSLGIWEWVEIGPGSQWVKLKTLIPVASFNSQDDGQKKSLKMELQTVLFH